MIVKDIKKYLEQYPEDLEFVIFWEGVLYGVETNDFIILDKIEGVLGRECPTLAIVG